MNIKKLITHNGSFHADDIFACAVLILYLDKTNNSFSAQGGPASGWEVIRTRDEEEIKTGDYVFDVGDIYDEEKNRFDHHQVGGAGKRVSGESEKEKGIEYASFGLVWKKFGIKLCEDQKVVEMVDKKLVAPIDAGDNGFNLVENKYEISPYFIQHVFSAMRPTWKEDDLKSRTSADGARHDFAKSNVDEIFLKCVDLAKTILSREIVQAQDSASAQDLVISIYQKTQNKKIIILDKNYSFEAILDNFPELLFVIYPKKTDNSWVVKAVRENMKTFDNRKDLPESWAGLRDEELQKITGVMDAVFCHRGLFLAVAKSKEGAIKLAELALLD